MNFSNEDLARIQQALNTQIEQSAFELDRMKDKAMQVIAREGLARTMELRDRVQDELNRICGGTHESLGLPPFD